MFVGNGAGIDFPRFIPAVSVVVCCSQNKFPDRVVLTHMLIRSLFAGRAVDGEFVPMKQRMDVT